MALTLLAVVGLPRGPAQTPVNTCVQGEVRDEHGLPMVGAAVRLSEAAGSRVQVIRTGRRGDFAFVGVEPGEYLLAVQQAWLPVWTGRVRVSAGVGEPAEVALRLRREASGVVLQAAGHDESDGEVWGASLDALPVPGRVWETTEAAASAVRDTTLPGGGAAQDGDEAAETASAREEQETGSAATGLSVDGMPVAGQTESVDGLTAEQSYRMGPRGAAAGGPRLGTSFAQGAIGRLRSGAQGYSAQTGGAAGGGVALSTRGATGRAGLHGSAFAQMRDSGWAAMNPYSTVATFTGGEAGAALVRPADTQVEAGATAGASVHVPWMPARWRVGLFGSVETRQRRQVLFSSPEGKDFFQLSGAQRAMLATRGVGTAATTAALNYLSGLAGEGTFTGGQWLSFGRVDAAPGRRDQLSLSYGGRQLHAPATAGAQVAEGVTSRALGSVGTSAVSVDAGAGHWEHRFGPRWVNEVRAQVVRDVEFETPGAGSASVPGIGPGGYAPQVAIAPEGFVYGTPASLGRVAYPDERRVEVGESSTWWFGRHLLTVGGSWSRVDDRVLGTTDREGSFLYDSGTTGGHAGGLVDWITDATFNVHAYPNGGCPGVTATVHYFCFRSYAQSFADAEVEFVTHEIAGYAEDAVRLSRWLRLTVGARWEYQLLPLPLAPNFALDAALTSAGLKGTAATATFPEDRNNVGPRVALRWSPGGSRGRGVRWPTVEAGYGMFFGRMPGATLNAALTETGMVSSTTSLRITPKAEVSCPQVANQGFGYPCAFPYMPAGVPEVTQTGGVMLFAGRFRLPAVQRASLAVEQGLGRRVVVRGEYATAWATQLPETTDLNIAPSTSEVSYVVQGGDGHAGLRTGQSFRVPLYTERRTAAFGPVSAIRSNANATYHSGTGEVTLRGWHGWGARAGGTFSRAIDYGPLVGPTPRQNGQFDPFAIGYDKGRSSLDRPWQVAGAVTYRSTWAGGGGEWARRALAGWGVAAIGRAGSGAPYSYVVFGGTRLPGGHESINGAGGATYLPTVGRNTLRLPMRSKLDVRASREIGLSGRGGRDWRLQVRADAFNVLNTVSVSRVETRAFLLGDEGSVGGMTPLLFQDAATIASEGLTTPAFGTPLSSTTGLSRERTLELGARLTF